MALCTASSRDSASPPFHSRPASRHQISNQDFRNSAPTDHMPQVYILDHSPHADHNDDLLGQTPQTLSQRVQIKEEDDQTETKTTHVRGSRMFRLFGDGTVSHNRILQSFYLHKVSGGVHFCDA